MHSSRVYLLIVMWNDTSLVSFQVDYILHVEDSPDGNRLGNLFYGRVVCSGELVQMTHYATIGLYIYSRVQFL